MSMPTGYSVQTEFDTPIPMRDGTILRANIYRPVGDGPFPVLVSRTPYGKDIFLGAVALDPVQAARRGYIIVIQDVRGRFRSAGEWNPFLHEKTDGYDTIEWAATMPGSNGNVGMVGASYLGFTQWSAARTQPPHLKSLVPFITWADSRDGSAFRGGAVELGLTRHWTTLNALDTELRKAQQTQDPRQIYMAVARVANFLDTMPSTGYAELPVKGFGARRGLDVFASFDEGIARRADPEYIDIGSVANGYDDVAHYPAFHIGGWHDIFLGGTLQNYTELTRRGKAPQKLLIGPWSHTTQDQRVGSVDFGFASSAALIDLQTDIYSLELRWHDRFLRGIENGIENEPPVQIFVMGINRWRQENAWPLNRAVATPMYFHSDGHANTGSGTGSLSMSAPEAEQPDTYVYDPQNPVPTHGGALLIHPLFQSGPQDQRVVERRQDVLVYTSDPLEQPLEVTGPISVTLFARSSAVDTDFVARLIDVHPDGFARPLTDGIIRARARFGFDREALLTPDEVYEFSIDLWATSNVFLPGHRIRVDITSSNFPRWDRNLNTGAPYGEGTETVVARQTILHDREHPSHIVLPVIPA